MTSATDPRHLLPEWLQHDIERSIRFRLLELPILPRVATEALAICQSEDGEIREVAKILHRDPAIAGNVLRIANSAMFGGSVEIKSLEQAASRIGMQRITEVVMVVATKSVTFETPAVWAECVEHLQRLSLVSALYAKEIARIRRSDPSTAFLSGLLHDMGWPSVMFLLRKCEQKHGQSIDLPVAKAAGEAYHARIGADLSAKWELSREVFNAIKHHEDWAKWDPVPVGAPVVSLADRLARVAMPEFTDTADSVLQHAAIRALDIEPEEARQLLDMSGRILELADLVN